jgi:putative transposase
VPALILQGPDPERDGISAWTRADIAELIERRFGVRYHVSSLSKILRRFGFSRQKTRPAHPGRRPKRPGSKKELPLALAAAKRAHPDKRIALYFQDEARAGQKGRVCHRWWLRGLRPTGPVDQRYTSAYVSAAVEPMSGQNFCLVLPEVSTAAMNLFLRRFSETLPADTHAVLTPGGAGWHTSSELDVSPNVTLFRLPPYSPELNPVERIWLYLCERYLSHRLHRDYDAVLEAACSAWRQLTTERLRSLCVAHTDHFVDPAVLYPTHASRSQFGWHVCFRTTEQRAWLTPMGARGGRTAGSSPAGRARATPAVFPRPAYRRP